ncbi:IS256 family transposase [Thiosulfativibrio zosterae]|uniref:Mutator family transposase n=1 Tax=Thiosulfativibrio zosterae TaxID=2675053 RepID=A0A6F8PQ93_9GAMM|nr:IS256 family transposase [Thiosulfativibrio zosterae]BBP44197.1 IS256 family transposase [Thiosulfativibrio zosterae]BBP44298.1 IS256 family transposase [Thiosulfativibrio zosterae]
MSNLDHKKLQELAKELAKSVKTQEDLSNLSSMLVKMTVEAALGAEMEEHLGYSKNQVSDSTNSRNGYTSKILKGDHGEVELSVPRDRNSTFEPVIVKKGATRLTHMDDQILSLYAKGMSTRDIVDAFKEMYGADVSPTLISKVTESVLEKVTQWQERPLDEIYPIIYLDGIVLKIRQDKQVLRKTMYVALGINLEGRKECLGLWLSENESSKFWLNVLNDLHARGVKDILIASVDGLTGFPEAINAVYPKTDIQLCIVHMVRNSLKYVGYKERKLVATDLKDIYQSVTEAGALMALERFEQKWDAKFPSISKSWRTHWDNVSTLFLYPESIRKAIYTTNAIESLNSVIRKAVNNRKIFGHDNSAFKIVFLAIESASKKWTMPIRDWNAAMNQFMILHEDRLKGRV